MKTLSLLVAVILFSTFSAGQTKDGFKGCSWGTSFDSMKSKFHLTLDQSDTHGKKKFLSNVTVMGAIPVTCYFYFYKDKFYSVRIDTRGNDHSIALLNMWQELHGHGFQQDAAEEFYMWEKVDNDTKAVYSKRSPQKTTSLTISSVSIQGRLDQDEKKIERKAKSDF